MKRTILLGTACALAVGAACGSPDEGAGTGRIAAGGTVTGGVQTTGASSAGSATSASSSTGSSADTGSPTTSATGAASTTTGAATGSTTASTSSASSTSGSTNAGVTTTGGPSSTSAGGSGTTGADLDAGATAGTSSTGGRRDGGTGTSNGGTATGRDGGTTAGAGRDGGTGGGAGDGGTAGDASRSPGDAGIGGASLCAAGKYLLCEGFEDTAVGNTPPTGWTRHGAASVASDDAARGTHSLKIAAATNGERRFYYTMASRFGTGHWGRIFYKVQLPVPDPFVHSTLVALEGTGPNVGAADYRVVDTVKNQGANASHQFLFNVQPSGAEYGKGSPYNWKFDGNWHCAEWHIDGAVQSYHFYFDGAEVTQIAIDNGAGNNGSGSNQTNIPMAFTDLRVGWNNYQAADPGFVAWIDEVAVDTTRIGCGN